VEKMNGWIEKNEKLKQQIEKHLKTLPEIFTEFYVDMQGDGKSYTTIKNYISYVEHFMNYVVDGNHRDDWFVSIKASLIKQYIASMSTRTNNDSTVKTSDDYQALRWSAINTFFKFLMLNEHIKQNPMSKTKRPKINTEHAVTYLTKKEIAEVMSSIEKNYTGKMLTRDRAIVGLSPSTGIRVSALVQINIEDIDFDNNTIKVVEKRTKTKEIHFGDNTKALLQAWLQTREQYYSDVETSALFLSQWKRRITTNGVRDLVAKYTKNINKHITPHKLRATAATQAAAAGVNVQTIKEMYNHGSIQTTMRYVAAINGEKKKAVNIMDNIF
jgi:site-specific recombinase XerD